MEPKDTTRLLNGSFKHGIGGNQRGHLKASRTRRYLVMTACIILQAISVGILFAMAVMYAELVAVFETKRSLVAVIQSIYSGMTYGAGVLLSPIMKRYGPGPSVCVGAIFGAICLASAFAANTILTLIIVVAIFGSFGMSFSYLASFVSASWISHDDPGLAVVVVSIGAGIGQCIGPYLVEIFIQKYNWNGAFLLLGGVALNCIPCGCLMYTSKDYFKTNIKKGDLSVAKSIKKICDVTLLSDVAVLLILLNLFLLAFTGNIEAWFFVDILSTRGFERERGSFLSTMIGLGNVVGRIIGSFIRFKIKIKTIYHWIYLWPIVGVCHILAISILDYETLVGICLIYGVALGTVTSQGQAIMFEVCGLERSPQGIAMVNLMYGIGSFCSSFFGGVIKDATGKYASMFYMSSALAFYVSVSTAILACILRRRDKLREAEEEKTILIMPYKKPKYGIIENTERNSR